ncbi:hypothetical protein GGF31_006229 [Allomyces arbusculus]|nr:hypothetical protein GGF31_006229 [Allomyces arbusculus]
MTTLPARPAIKAATATAALRAALAIQVPPPPPSPPTHPWWTPANASTATPTKPLATSTERAAPTQSLPTTATRRPLTVVTPNVTTPRATAARVSAAQRSLAAWNTAHARAAQRRALASRTAPPTWPTTTTWARPVSPAEPPRRPLAVVTAWSPWSWLPAPTSPGTSYVYHCELCVDGARCEFDEMERTWQ